MTSLLATISGQFGKSIIMGAFFPSVVFIVLNMFFVVPLWPAGWTPPAWVKDLDTHWPVLLVTFLTILLSGLLYLLNTPIIRLHEGYPWKESCIGEWRKKRYQNEFETIQARWTGMSTLLHAMDIHDEHYSKVYGCWTKFGIKMREFPWKSALVMPTRLGNVIRGFEHYPVHQYRIDAIEMWPRLINKIPTTYAAIIDDAKTSFDFMINLSFLMTLLALETFVVGLLYPAFHVSNIHLLSQRSLMVILFLCFSFLFYILSIPRASAWGATVKSAFDLFRWELLSQLGYQQKLKTDKEECRTWELITVRMIYGRLPYDPIFEYSPRTVVRVNPANVALEYARSVNVTAAGKQEIAIYIKNVDPNKCAAEDIVLTDTLPEGYFYISESANLNHGSVSVNGINPYHFKIGSLHYNKETILRYGITRLP